MHPKFQVTVANSTLINTFYQHRQYSIFDLIVYAFTKPFVVARYFFHKLEGQMEKSRMQSIYYSFKTSSINRLNCVEKWIITMSTHTWMLPKHIDTWSIWNGIEFLWYPSWFADLLFILQSISTSQPILTWWFVMSNNEAI